MILKVSYKPRVRLQGENGSVIPATNPLRLSAILGLESGCFLHCSVYYWLVLGGYQALWVGKRGMVAVYNIPVNFYPFSGKLVRLFESLLEISST